MSKETDELDKIIFDLRKQSEDSRPTEGCKAGDHKLSETRMLDGEGNQVAWCVDCKAEIKLPGKWKVRGDK